MSSGFLVWECLSSNQRQDSMDVENQVKTKGEKYSKCIEMTRYFSTLVTSTDLRLTALIWSLFLFSSIFMSSIAASFFWGKRPKHLPLIGSFFKKLSPILRAKKSTTSIMCGPIIESLISDEWQDISGSVERKSQSSGAGCTTYIKL